MTITKIELDSKILNNELIKGKTYEISGCNVSLFGGTTIIVKAIETNRIETNATAIFYTPDISYEAINYDYANDSIISNIDLLGNEITFNKLDTEWFNENFVISQSAIYYFKKVSASIFSGVWNNTVENSIVDTINFGGQLFSNNTFKKLTGFINNSFALNSNFNDNILGIKTIFTDNSFGINSAFINNILTSAVNFSTNTIGDYCSLNNIEFKSSSSFYENTIGNTTTISFVSIGIRSLIANCIFPSNKVVTKLTIEDSVKIENIDFTDATILFDIALNKSIFQLPNGDLKIRYYDNSGNLIICNINE